MSSRDVLTRLKELITSLRSAVAGMLLMLGVGVLIVWGASLKYNLEFFNNVSEYELYCVESWDGKLRLSHSTNIGKTYQLNQWIFWSIEEQRMLADYAVYTREWKASRFGGTWNQDEISLFLPHWCWATLSAMLAYGIKPKPKFQLSFFDLCMMTVLVAIVIGGFVASSRGIT